MGACSSKANKEQQPKEADIGQLMKDTSKYHKEQGGSSLHFTRLELKHLISVYTSMKGGSSALSRAQFQSELQLNEEETDLIFAAFDSDGSGSIDLKEMISGFSFVCKGSTAEKYGFLFRLFDTDGNLELDREEFGKMLHHLSRQVARLDKSRAAASSVTTARSARDASIITAASSTVQRKISVSENVNSEHHSQQHSIELANQAFQEADGNGDGRISLIEFEKWVVTNPSAIEFMETLRQSCNRICGITNAVYYQRASPIDPNHPSPNHNSRPFTTQSYPASPQQRGERELDAADFDAI